jgi:hypothetical protein
MIDREVSPMAMPVPNDHHKKLHRLAGSWVGEEKIRESHFSPAGTAIGRYTCRVDLDGFFVVQDYEQTRDGKISYRGHGIFGWDAHKKTSTWYWVDSLGDVPHAPSRGHWKGDTVVFESEAVDRRRGRYTYAFLGDDAYDFKIENSHDNGKTWHTFMEASYRRQI